jgi:hypothetical protein
MGSRTGLGSGEGATATGDDSSLQPGTARAETASAATIRASEDGRRTIILSSGDVRLRDALLLLA